MNSNRIYNIVLIIVAAGVLLLLAAIFLSLFSYSLPALRHFGVWDFLSSPDWISQQETEKYGALGFLASTFATAILSIAISFPFSLSLSLFTGDLHREGKISRWVERIVSYAAAIPSIVIGVWGFYIIRPILISLNIGYQGFGILSAAIVLSLMIIPYTARICTTFVKRAPQSVKEAAFTLGANRQEVAYRIILPLARNGIIGAHVVALGRALGETVIVVIMIGNTLGIPKHIMDTGSSMTSILANQLGSSSELKLSALIAIAFLLFVLTLVVNYIGKLIMDKSYR